MDGSTPKYVEDMTMNDHLDDEELEESNDEEGEENSQLEQEFQDHWEKYEAKIQALVDEAHAALTKAVKLADKQGIPFYSSVSFLGQNYTPAVLERFSEIDQQRIDDITGTYNEYGGEGWQHSDVC